MDGMTFRKRVGPGIVLAGPVGPPETAVPLFRKISSEPNLRERWLAVGLIERVRELRGSSWSTVLEAATGNTGSMGHSDWPCWKHYNHTAPGCTQVSVEHSLA